MLEANEELWEKELDPVVEGLLSGSSYQTAKINEKNELVYEVNKSKSTVRDKTKVVTYKAENNSAI